MKKQKSNDIFSYAEVKALVFALVQGNTRMGKDITMGEAERFVAWAEEVRTNATILNTILAGKVVVSYDQKDELTLHPGQEYLS